jgi:hypothetical protein
MALFMDGSVSSMDDLTAQDSQLLDTANVENIDVTRKLALAQDELGLDLDTLLTRLSYTEQPFWYTSPPKISTVVVTRPLKMWHTFRALEMVYADAYNSQLNDRYAGKRDQFHARAQWAYEKLVQTGLGIASDPIPQAATPTVTIAAGGLADGTYYVTMAWMNREGEEGASAVPIAIATAGSSLLAQPVNAPPNATGWRVYVGGAPDSMVLQNESPIAIGQTWLQPDTLVTVGPAPGSGQQPNYTRPVPRMIQRG